MKTQTYHYKSTGKTHQNESGFFKFLVNQEFNELKNNSIQWCSFDGLTITVTALEPEVIEFADLVLKGGFKSFNTVYSYELTSK